MSGCFPEKLVMVVAGAYYPVYINKNIIEKENMV